MAYAIVEAGGKQFRVEPGRFYDINRLHAEEDETVTLDRVLFVSSDAGIEVGQPLVTGATVSGTVMRHLRGPKLIVYKMRPKKKTRKKRGHRQELTRLMIDSISVGDSVFSLDDTEAEESMAVEADAETADVVEAEAAVVETPEAEAPETEATEAEATEAEALEVEAPEAEAAEAEADTAEAVEETADEATPVADSELFVDTEAEDSETSDDAE